MTQPTSGCWSARTSTRLGGGWQGRGERWGETGGGCGGMWAGRVLKQQQGQVREGRIGGWVGVPALLLTVSMSAPCCCCCQYLADSPAPCCSAGCCRAPPPHLSPFVAEEEEGYVPEYGQQLKQLQVGPHAISPAHAKSQPMDGWPESWVPAAATLNLVPGLKKHLTTSFLFAAVLLVLAALPACWHCPCASPLPFIPAASLVSLTLELSCCCCFCRRQHAQPASGGRVR